MASFNINFQNTSQPYFSGCSPPSQPSKEQTEACFGGKPTNTSAMHVRNVNILGDNASNFLEDAPKLLKAHQPGQQEQLEHTRKKTKELDALLAKSMAELSFQERQQHQEVLHGVVRHAQEDEQQIETWLRELDHRLQARIAASNGDSKTKAYVYAHQTNPAYVQNRPLRLMFLRSNEYDPEPAADQFIRFFATKEKLFGRHKLCKDITLADMDDNDKTSILSGVLQTIGEDQAGRPIMLEFVSLRAESPTMQSELRARYYLFLNVLMNNPSAQIKGIVLIVYAVDQFQDQSGGTGFVENASMVLSLPVQFAGLHLCISDLKQYVISTGVLKLIPTKWRARFKVHLGSHLECQYRLSTYGIPVDNLPLIPNTNEAQMDYHWQWYRECFMKESSADGKNYSTDALAEEHYAELPKFLWNLPCIPRTNDVLFHRRKTNHGGNQRLRALARHLLQAYNKGNKLVKRELVDYMIADISNTGGRFLKQDEERMQEADDNDAWKLVEEPEIREKIGQMFRNHRRPNVQLQQQELEPQHRPAILSTSQMQNLLERTATTDATNDYDLLPPSPPTSPARSQPHSSSKMNYAANSNMSVLHDEHNDADVLFGRRRNNGGNKLVRKMVSELADEYEAANRARKLEITNTIVEQVQAFGGRFLRKTDDDRSWEEVSNDYARSKISKHFRNHRRPQTKAKQPAAAAALLGNSASGKAGISI